MSTHDVALPVAPQVWRITTPMPHRPREVHAYLVRSADRWFLLDGGIDSPAAWEALDAGVREVAGDWRAVSLLVVSHMHMDHLGLVRRGLAASGAELAMGSLDAARAAHAAADPEEEAEYRDAVLHRTGGDEQLAALAGAPRAASEFPPVRHPLPGPGGPLPGVPAWEYVWTPGHTAGHISLLRAGDRVLLAGDCVLPGITPTIGVNRQREDPVADQLDSLRRLADLDPSLSCGGHGEPVEYPAARIAELREETLAESARVLEPSRRCAAHHRGRGSGEIRRARSPARSPHARAA